MSIAEKLLTTAKNQEEVYHAGAIRFAITEEVGPSDNITLTDSSDYKMINFKMDGKTEQKTYTGKNLFDTNILVDGQMMDSTGSTGNKEGYCTTEPIRLFAGTYTFSCVNESTNIVIVRFDSNGNRLGTPLNAVVSSKKFTTDIETSYIRVSIGASKEVADTMNIQIEQGSEATDYEPYVGSKLKSANMFDVSKIQNGDYVTNNGDGSITLTAYGFSSSKLTDVIPGIKAGMTIVITATNPGKYVYFGGNVLSVNSAIEVTQAMIDNNIFGFYGKDDTTADNPLIISNIMVNEGTTALPYQPFERWVGNNLFDISKFNSSTSFVNNGDGSITCIGYAPNMSTNKISECCPNIVVGQTIIYSATNNGPYIYFGGSIKNANISFVVTQAMLDDDRFGFYGKSDSSKDNPLTMSDIMINEGTTALPYEPYQTYDPTVMGIISSPNPFYPQEIVNAAKLGKNLFDKEYAADPNNWKFYDNEFYLGLPVYVGKGNNVAMKYHQTLPGGINMYACVCNNDQYESDNNKQWIYHSTTTAINNLVRYITSVSDYIYVFCIKDAIESGDFMKYIGEYFQIEIGSEATEYESYGRRIKMDIFSNNLFDIDDFKATTELVTLGNYKIYKLNTVPGQTYTFYRNTTAGYDVEGLNNVRIVDGDGNSLGILIDKWTESSNKSSVSFVAADETYLAFTQNISKVLTYFDTYFINPQLVRGSEATRYQPYQSTSITLTPQMPLTKWDKLEKIDGVWGWSINSEELKLSNYVWTMGNQNNDNNGYVFYTYLGAENIYMNKESLCKYLILDKDNNSWENMSVNTYRLNDYIIISINKSSLADFENWLTEYDVSILAECSELNFIPLPDEQQILLNKLSTIYGGTSVSNDQGCPMQFSYIVDPELYGGDF